MIYGTLCPRRRRARHRWIAVLAIAFVGLGFFHTKGTKAAVYTDADRRPHRASVYFDAHNHFPGILPYYAYANLPAFIARISNSSQAVTFDDRLALYR